VLHLGGWVLRKFAFSLYVVGEFYRMPFNLHYRRKNVLWVQKEAGKFNLQFILKYQICNYFVIQHILELNSLPFFSLPSWLVLNDGNYQVVFWERVSCGDNFADRD
jgi:hypothetical protein